MSKYDVLIAGSGIGGMMCGALLAHAGLKVYVIEREDRLGGCLVSFAGSEIGRKMPLAKYHKMKRNIVDQWEVRVFPEWPDILNNNLLDGYHLDMGVHIFFQGGKNCLTYKKLGLDLDWYKLEAPRLFDGKNYLKIEPTKDPEKIQVMMTELSQIVPELALTDLMNIMGSLMEFDVRTINRCNNRSLWEWLVNDVNVQTTVVQDMMQTLVGAIVQTINNPREITLGETIRCFKALFDQDIFVGMPAPRASKVIEELERYITNRGGKCERNIGLKRFIIENGTCLGVEVETDGKKTSIEAPIVISNVKLYSAMRQGIIDEDQFPSRWIKEVKTIEPAGAVVYYLGLNKMLIPEEYRTSTITCSNVLSWENMLYPNTANLSRSRVDDWDIRFSWVVDSEVDKNRAPAGKHLIAAWFPLRFEGLYDFRRCEIALDASLDKLEAFYPGFKKSIDWMIADSVPLGLGTMESPFWHDKKPSFKAPNIKNLYFVGDTIESIGPAMDTGTHSSFLVAGEITGKDYFEEMNIPLYWRDLG
jgi:phytoene dehydrogenase-like protein